MLTHRQVKLFTLEKRMVKADILIGNVWNNTLKGGAGDDRIYSTIGSLRLAVVKISSHSV